MTFLHHPPAITITNQFFEVKADTYDDYLELAYPLFQRNFSPLEILWPKWIWLVTGKCRFV